MAEQAETPPADIIRIAVVDDHPVTIAGLITMCGAIPRCQVVFTGGDGQDMLNAPPEVFPLHIAIVDMRMPRVDGPATIRWLREHHPDVRVLGFSFYDHDAVILDAMNAGAHGFLVKDGRPEDLATAVDHLMTTGHYRTDLVQRCLAANPDGLTAQERERRKLLKDVSERELEIWKTVCDEEERTNHAAGEELGLSPRTIETHCRNICAKIGARSRVGLTLLGTRLGVLK